MIKQTKSMRVGDLVTIRDENGSRVDCRVHSFGQANDGTGRHGVLCESLAEPGTIWWRPSSELAR